MLAVINNQLLVLWLRWGTNSDGGQEVEMELDRLERLEELETTDNISIFLQDRAAATIMSSFFIK